MPNLRDFTLNFVGNDEHTLAVDGDFFHIMSASAPLQISFDNGPLVTRNAGQSQTVRDKFRRIRIMSLVPQIVVLACGFDRLEDNRAEIAAVNVAATVEAGNQNISLPAVSVGAGLTVQVAPSNLARKALLVQASFNNDPAIIPLIGGADVTAIKGVECIAGAGLPPIETTASVWCHNPGAAAVVIRCLEINKI